MVKIFLSYRRFDSAYATGAIRDEICRRMPDSEVFLDVDSIPYGVDFRNHLEGCVANCDYLVAVIGKSWLQAQDRQGNRRLDDPHDYVRIEIETALARGVPLIPVCLDNIDVPTVDQLPESLRDLVTRNVIFVRPPPDFHRDIEKLVNSLSQQPQATVDPAKPVTTQNRTSRGWPFRGLWTILVALIALLALITTLSIRSRAEPALAKYEFTENYLFEDSNSRPTPWQPHPRTADSKFRLPVGYVHWVIVVTYPPDVQPGDVPLDCHLSDDEGEVVRFSGLGGTLPDATYPAGGKTQWFINFGGRSATWKPGTYKIELSTPTKSLTTSFEILPPLNPTKSDQPPE